MSIYDYDLYIIIHFYILISRIKNIMYNIRNYIYIHILCTHVFSMYHKINSK